MSKNEFAVMCHSRQTNSSCLIPQTERKNDPTMGGIV